MIVTDASVIVELLLESPRAARIRGRLLAAGQTVHAPHLLDLEVAQTLRRFCLSGELSPARAELAPEFLSQFPLQRHSHTPMLPRIWQLRHNLTACDAAYVALAELLSAPLLTRDPALAASAGHLAVAELV